MSTTTGQRSADAFVLGEVLLAALHVLADGDPEALDQVVVLHEPGQVLRAVLRRLGREVAEAPVEGEDFRRLPPEMLPQRLLTAGMRLIPVREPAARRKRSAKAASPPPLTAANPWAITTAG